MIKIKKINRCGKKNITELKKKYKERPACKEES